MKKFLILSFFAAALFSQTALAEILVVDKSSGRGTGPSGEGLYCENELIKADSDGSGHAMLETYDASFNQGVIMPLRESRSASLESIQQINDILRSLPDENLYVLVIDSTVAGWADRLLQKPNWSVYSAHWKDFSDKTVTLDNHDSMLRDCTTIDASTLSRIQKSKAISP